MFNQFPPNSYRRVKDTHFKSFLAASFQLIPIGQKDLSELALRFSIKPKHLYVSLNKMRGNGHG